MNDSAETLEQPTKDDAVLQAIANLAKIIGNLQAEFNTFKIETKTQFNEIRQAIVHKSARFDRLEAQVHSLRSDVFNLKADIKELTVEVRQNRNGLALK